jgi:phosphate transport system substrate-binding protein
MHTCRTRSSALQIVYNLPGLNAFPGSLRVSGPVLAGIYAGRIRYWNDPAIAALNPGVVLPQRAIVPVWRSDASGSTFVFTQFLSFSTPWWDRSYDAGQTFVGPHVDGARTARQSKGMVRVIATTPYSIGYAGVGVADEVARDGLGTAWVQNAYGDFVLPTAQSIAAAAAQLAGRTPSDERLTLAFAKGSRSYPLVNYEYAIVSHAQRDAATAAAIRDFLTWCIAPSDERALYLNAVHFIGLPAHTWELSQAQIAKIR